MAFTSSGLFVQTWIDILDTTQLAIDLTLTTHRVALFTNSVTPDYSQSSPVPAYAVAPFNANEVSGTGYTAGGNLLLSTTVSESPSSVLMWDAADTAWTTSTIASARGALIYADALAGNNAIAGVTFGGDYSTTAGTFTIVWNSLGIVTIDLY